MLVVWRVRRPKPRFCQVLVSSSSFGAHFGVCKNKSGSVIPRASSTRGVKCHGENTAKMTLFWWIPRQGLTKIPRSNGTQRWKTKQRRPSKLVTISARFSRCIYFAEHLCKVLWSQDAIWRREIQFNRVREASRPDALFNFEWCWFYQERWVLRHKQWEAQESGKVPWIIARSHRRCLLDISEVNLDKSYLEQTSKICQVAPWGSCEVCTVPE